MDELSRNILRKSGRRLLFRPHPGPLPACFSARFSVCFSGPLLRRPSAYSFAYSFACFPDLLSCWLSACFSDRFSARTLACFPSGPPPAFPPASPSASPTASPSASPSASPVCFSVCFSGLLLRSASPSASPLALCLLPYSSSTCGGSLSAGSCSGPCRRARPPVRAALIGPGLAQRLVGLGSFLSERADGFRPSREAFGRRDARPSRKSEKFGFLFLLFN